MNQKKVFTLIFISLLAITATASIAYAKDSDTEKNNGVPFQELRDAIQKIQDDLTQYLTDEVDPLFTSSAANDILTSDISNWGTAYNWGDHSTEGYLTGEADPQFTASAAYDIQNWDISDWNNAYSWGDHSTEGYLTDEADPKFTASAASGIQSPDITKWNTAYNWGDHTEAGYLTTEVDPIYTASTAAGIQETDLSKWNTAYGWGDHSTMGYLNDEVDPVFGLSAASGIQSGDISDWNTAYGWGDHTTEGYLTTETDPVFSSSTAHGIQATDVSNWDIAYSWGDHSTMSYLTGETDPHFTASAASGIQSGDISDWDTAYGWGDHSTMSYLTSEADPHFTASAASGILTPDINNWNTAYNWGNHLTAGYLTTETDPYFTGSTAYNIQPTDITNWNSVSWDEITNIPPGFADAIDNEGTGNRNSLDAADGNPINAVYVDAVGRVGIGTTTPRTGLHVVAEPYALLLSSDHDINWPSGEALSFNELYTDGTYKQRMRIKDDGTINMYGGKSGHLLYLYNDQVPGEDEDGIWIQLGDSDPGKNNNFITFADKEGVTKGRIEGFLATEWTNLEIEDMLELGMDPIAWAVDRAVRNHGVAYASGSGDYAEYLQKLDPEEQIGPFNIVGVHGGLVSKKTEDADMAMIISWSPVVVGNTPPEGEEHLYEPVAFMGQVPVKVIGQVSIGDYILPSGLEDGSGIAVSPDDMTVTDYSRIVGMAWSESDTEELALILCAVGLNSNDMASLIEQQGQQLMEQQDQIDELETLIQSLITRVDELEKTN